MERKQYSLDELLSIATNPASRETPSEWHRISREFPSVVKKVSEPWSCGYSGDYVGNYSNYYYEYDYDCMSHFMNGYYPNGFVTGYMGDMHAVCPMKWNGWTPHKFSHRMIPVFRPT